MSEPSFDVVIAGAGIVGLAHALAAAKRGLRVAVVERDRRCVGASIRNFGFVTVTGQAAGDTWRRARRSRDVWREVAQAAGIRIEQRGVWVLAQRPAARAVLEAFVARSGMAEGCRLHEAAELATLAPSLRSEGAAGALYSPHELRVESRDAIPRLAQWLADAHGVRFFFGEAVLEADAQRVRTAQRTLNAERTILCPGAELGGVGGERLAPHGLRLTRLQMLRVRAQAGFRLDAPLMTDLSLIRYGGFASLSEAQVLRAQLQAEEGESLAHGIHLIAVQSADGTLVVGDSHHDDGTAPSPFASEAVDRLILAHLQRALSVEHVDVVERWSGVYPSGGTSDCLIDAPNDAMRIVVVTSGTGASTAFAIAEDVFDGW
jgi:FAD dependent oxidoreductase TIGR03364